jgi:hypothetical protein
VVRQDYDEYVRLVKMFRIANRNVTSGDAAQYVDGSAMDPSAHMGRETVLLEWLRKRWA